MTQPPPHIHWQQIDTVLLDMDGTLLDLQFDQWFWTEHLPHVYAHTHGLALAEVKAEWSQRLSQYEQRLQWYCIDHWSELLRLDVAAIKRQVKARVRWLPGAQAFLAHLKALGKQRLLITNAHPLTLMIKNDVTGLMPWFDQCISSHEYQAPKEDARFWPKLVAATGIVPKRCLFIDDSLPVLRAAAQFGLGQIIAVSAPDSQQAPREITEFASVTKLTELM
jgi:5'-nucleotidase